MEPLIGAIAAGNCCVVKPSAYSPAVSAIIRDLLAECFPPEFVSVVEGGQTLLHKGQLRQRQPHLAHVALVGGFVQVGLEGGADAPLVGLSAMASSDSWGGRRHRTARLNCFRYFSLVRGFCFFLAAVFVLGAGTLAWTWYVMSPEFLDFYAKAFFGQGLLLFHSTFLRFSIDENTVLIKL